MSTSAARTAPPPRSSASWAGAAPQSAAAAGTSRHSACSTSTSRRPDSALVVETVSINVEDFSESFLTCGTCLCAYDQKQRRPKLLGCSHTVCSQCLATIAAMPQAQDTGHIRCPICREAHHIPRAGIAGLPPSFLVNQLIDLMHKQRRSIVPKCTLHASQELLFCETCDRVFCAACHDQAASGGATYAANGSDGSGSPETDDLQMLASAALCHNHTIVPFSIAIKRMSEIMLYKANQCVRHLQRAAENVQAEMGKLDTNVDTILDDVNASFQHLGELLEVRKRELIESVRRTRDEKRRILQEQLNIVQAERAGVEQHCSGLQYQVDVRTITQRIADLNVKLDQALTLLEPRENAFLRYDASTDDVLYSIQLALERFGQLYASRTFPPLCTVVHLPPEPAACPDAVSTRAPINASIQCASNLRCSLLVTTIDYNGAKRTGGGDPVRAKIVRRCCDSRASPGAAVQVESLLQVGCDKCASSSRPPPPEVAVEDRNDGTYFLNFRPTTSGDYRLHIVIFDRPVKGSPFDVKVTNHHRPLSILTTLSPDHGRLSQPVKVVCAADDVLHVLDSGNHRVVRVQPGGQVVGEVKLDVQREGQLMPPAPSCAVGLAVMPARCDAGGPTVFTLDWRTRLVSQWSAESGKFIRSFTFSQFVEPIDMAIDAHGRIIVLDSGARKVFAFEHDARPLFSFPVRCAPTSNCHSPKRALNGAAAEKIENVQPLTGCQSQTLSPVRRTRPKHGAPVGEQAALTCLGIGINDDILVGTADGNVFVFDAQGSFVRSMSPGAEVPNGSATPLISAVCADRPGSLVLAAVSDPARHMHYVAVLSYKGALKFTLDSDGAKLKRPAGICVSADKQFVWVADLAADAVKKYAYK